MNSFIDHTINGLIIGNIYALVAVGLALIFGVSNLINFAHGAVYMVGAYIGWVCVVILDAPLFLAVVSVLVGCALLGVIIERVGLRPFHNAPRIAPLLATIGIGLVLEQIVQLLFTPDPRALPNLLPAWRLSLGSGSIGALDLCIAATGIVSATVLYGFLRFTRLGWAVRATAQDRDAALQMGVNVHRVNQIVFAIASALGGLSGIMVGMYFNNIFPAMGFQATLKGFVAELIGGAGNVPGAIVGSLLLGLIESYGIAILGTSYRNLFAFLILIAVLVWRPNGIFSSARQLPPEPLTGTFIAPSKPLHVPYWAVIAVAIVLAVLPLIWRNSYVLQTLTNAWLYAILALSLTLVAGTTGQISLGHAGLLAIGGYASALLALDLHAPIPLAILLAGIITAVLSVVLLFPSFRLRGHYVAIATLAIGEIVSLIILNWEGLTRGPIGVVGIPPLEFFGIPLYETPALYWVSFAAMITLALLQRRLTQYHLGRALRAIREDDVAARASGISLNRYKGLAFAFSGFVAGISGAITAHMYSYINHETFNTQISLLGLTMVILGGMGNVLGAIVGAVTLIALPEIFRTVAEYRILLYGIVLLLLVRFRPQGILGTV
ncbi:MAG: ABC transporter permease [Roseiflexaceae bacterium]|nr:ABC transporter permease [Roseiflexaceae bacterium]